MTTPLAAFSSFHSLAERLEQIHATLLEKISSLDRIAVALYDPKTDLLKTFINSTGKGQAICSYEYKLANCPSLLALAEAGQCRVINNIPSEIKPDSEHSRWLLEQCYKSSFTLPMINGNKLLGFIFFDSFDEGVFTDTEQRNLLLYSNLIIMALSSELFAVSSLLATVSVARDFAHLRDFETGKHLDRLSELSRLIAKNLQQQYQLSDQFVEYVYLFAPLHDIGKIGIPDEILLKPGRLDPEERQEMETHVQKGVDILHKVLADYDIAHMEDSKLMVNIIAYHHEFMDGSGYPYGLRGNEIPVEARIITVADIFDALTSTRPYKQPWTVAEALRELEQMAQQGKLDPLCVQALRDNVDEAARVVTELRD